MADETWTIGTAPPAAKAPEQESWSLGGPSGVQPTERTRLERFADNLRRAQVEGIGGTIAYPMLRARGFSPEQIKQAREDYLNSMDALDRQDELANPNETNFHKFITGKWIDALGAAIGGQPETLIGGGGKTVAHRLANAAGSAEAVDAVNQGLQKVEGLRDDIDWKRLNDTGALNAVLGLPLEGLAALRGKLFPKAEPDVKPKPDANIPPESITPEQLAAVDEFIKTHPNATAEELRAMGVGNADEVVAARDKGANVTSSVAGDAEHTVVDNPDTPALEVGVTDEAPPIEVTAPKEGAFKYNRDAGDGSHFYDYEMPDGTVIPVRGAIDRDTITLPNGKEITGNIATLDIDKFNDANKNAFGPVEQRNALFDFVNQFPEADVVTGFRRSGAKPGRVQTIEITDKIREQAAAYEAAKARAAPEPTVPGVKPEEVLAAETAPKHPEIQPDAPLTPQQAMERAAAQLRANNATEMAQAESDTVLQGAGRQATPVALEDMPKYAGSVNLDRLDSEHAVDEYILEQSKTIPRTYQSNEETEAAAAEMVGTGIDALLKKNPTLAEHPAHVVALGNAMLEATNKVVELGRDWKAGKNSDADLLAYQKAVLTQRLLQERYNASAGSIGRTLQALNIIKTAGGDYAKALADLSKIGEPLASREGLQAFSEAMQGINDPSAISKMIRDTTQRTWWDKVMSVRYNMMLSGPRTHFANNIGIFSHVTYDLMTHAMASVFGQTKRFSQGAERVAAREVAARVEGMVSALMSGAAWKNARKALNEGDILDATGKAEHTIQATTGKASLIELPSRALNAEDEFWRTMIENGSTYGLAHRQAVKEGLKGQQFKDRVQWLIDNPTKEMKAQTDEYTHRMLFRDEPTPVTAALQQWRRIRSTDAKTVKVIKGATQLIFPFLRTPDRLVMTGVRNSPLGAFERVNIAEMKAGGASADVAKARLAMGTALATWAVVKALNGELTGQGPDDYEKRDEWTASGRRPNSIKVGDEYRDISNLQPLSLNLTAIASLVERAREGKESEDSYAEKAKHLTGDLIETLGTNTWTSSMADLGKIFTSESGLANYTAGLVASTTVPAFVRQYNQADPAGTGDPSVRSTVGDGSMTDRVLGRVAAGIPGLSDELPQKYNVYGKPVMREGTLGPDYLSNVNISTLDKDPAVVELSRLGDSQPGPLVGPVEKTLQVPDEYGGGKVKLDDRQYQEYQKLAGEYITGYVRGKIEDGSWAKMSEEEKLADLKGRSGAIAEAKAQARMDLFWEPQDGQDWSLGKPETSQAKELKAAVEGKTGARVTSDLRTREEQQYLYDHFKGVAKPGTSAHEKDRAIDVVPTRGMSPQSLKAEVESLGYTGVRINTRRHGSGPHWHVSWTGKEEWTL